jgi:hypothetical protein
LGRLRQRRRTGREWTRPGGKNCGIWFEARSRSEGERLTRIFVGDAALVGGYGDDEGSEGEKDDKFFHCDEAESRQLSKR